MKRMATALLLVVVGCNKDTLDDNSSDIAESSGQCTPDCTIAVCGDGYLWEGIEECDDGNLDFSDECVEFCKLATCGDGFVWEGVEECDDGNLDDSDQCSSDCVAL